MNIKFNLTRLLFPVLTILLITSCGDSSTTSPSSRSYLATQAPGDVWTWTLNSDATFTAQNTTPVPTHDYSGTYTLLPSGFLKLTVTATTDPAMVTLPSIAYALEFPNTALLIQPARTGPAGTPQPAIVGAALGTCPSANATYNWVSLLDSTWIATTDEAYGITNATVTGSTFDFSHNRFRIDGTALAGSADTGFTCSGGTLTHPSSLTTIAATPSGVFIGDAGPGAGGFVGVQAPATNIAISDLLLTGREYRGFTFNDGATISVPVWARPNGATTLLGGEYTNIETGVEATGNVTVSFNTQANPGVINGVLTDLGGTSDMVMTVGQVNGRYMIYGVQRDNPSAVGGNFLLIEQ